MADGVQIRTELVTEFARTIGADTFREAAAQGAGLHQHGVVFGAAIPGDIILEAKRRYAQMLEHTEANLREYRRAAASYAAAAEQLAHDLAAADHTTEETLRPLHPGQQ
ncbi:hypothetical protein [Actinoplanes sp. N902-109]|uniref:hypothetical protein n=1 Tax=Actinoplanes sp. (strain N902-109) TaxID=649831 RepID=UPI0003295368|nr:hypothetical protein [Actinoplanes sp. N902-109]AGL15221.1 hypothetical protein L083_1711 [Actinoplanes sp. N902-109]